MPDNRNKIPIAIVNQVTELSGYLSNKMPITMEQMARKNELCNSFISSFVYFYCAKIGIFSQNAYLCSMKMTTIYLVRHGETVDNARQIMQGQTQGELNETGYEQARQVAERLADEPIDAVVASDLHRAIQTAEIIAQKHGLPVVTTPLLRERDWGSFTGRFIPDLRGEVWPDDIESEEALLQRALDFLKKMTATYEGKRVVAVGHGIINKAILAVYAHCTMSEVQRMMNAEVRVLTTSSVAVASTTAATSAHAVASTSETASAATTTVASAE